MRRGILILLLFILAGAIFIFRNHRTAQVAETEFNHNETRLIFTKHAKCRMDCRHITEDEIRAVLKSGTINYNKSDPNGKPDPKYALEGKPADHRLRVVFAPTNRGMVVITCIDLDEDWYCDCS